MVITLLYHLRQVVVVLYQQEQLVVLLRLLHSDLHQVHILIFQVVQVVVHLN